MKTLAILLCHGCRCFGGGGFESDSFAGQRLGRDRRQRRRDVGPWNMRRAKPMPATGTMLTSFVYVLEGSIVMQVKNGNR